MEPSHKPLHAAYKVNPGAYSWSVVKSYTPKSASDAELLSETLRQENVISYRLSELTWTYTRVNVGSVRDAFVMTLSKYARRSDEQIKREIFSYSLSDYLTLSEFARKTYSQYPNLDNATLARMRSNFLNVLIEETERIYIIHEVMKNRSMYWPPILVGHDVMDGAHRLVAINAYMGASATIWAWTTPAQARML